MALDDIPPMGAFFRRDFYDGKSVIWRNVAELRNWIAKIELLVRDIVSWDEERAIRNLENAAFFLQKQGRTVFALASSAPSSLKIGRRQRRKLPFPDPDHSSISYSRSLYLRRENQPRRRPVMISQQMLVSGATVRRVSEHSQQMLVSGATVRRVSEHSQQMLVSGSEDMSALLPRALDLFRARTEKIIRNASKGSNGDGSTTPSVDIATLVCSPEDLSLAYVDHLQRHFVTRRIRLFLYDACGKISKLVSTAAVASAVDSAGYAVTK